MVVDPLTIMIVIAAMLAFTLFNEGLNNFRTSYKCPVCRAKTPDDHADDCPWK